MVTLERIPVKRALTDYYPVLWFAGAAQRFVELCGPENLLWQLSSRGISEIRSSPFFSFSGEGMCIGGDGKFIIQLDDVAAPREVVVSIGRMIGQTFQYNTTKKPPKDTLQPWLRGLAKCFCDQFSGLWLDRVGVVAARSLIPTGV